MAAGDGVLRDFPVHFQQGRFKDRKADKDLVLLNAYNGLTQPKCIRRPLHAAIRSAPTGRRSRTRRR